MGIYQVSTGMGTDFKSVPSSFGGDSVENSAPLAEGRIEICPLLQAAATAAFSKRNWWPS